MSYFETNEINDIQMLYKFNSITHLFESIEQRKEKDQCDATAIRNGKTYTIELKRRFVPLDKYKTMFIEDYKLAHMMLEYTIHNSIPLYICFLHDAILIFNLAKLKKMPQLRILNIESKGYEKMQNNERRYLLDIDDAAIYVNNVCVKRANEQWKGN